MSLCFPPKEDKEYEGDDSPLIPADALIREIESALGHGIKALVDAGAWFQVAKASTEMLKTEIKRWMEEK